ncbi:hypothetical protein LOK49_LG01G01619 [Camellia lanceoleosa]|uniref:Uncharacterized protein n=1 Tax=Camellia lanceoleosa TaxID=1840588 RepID=A0ACC0J4X1_9ERIC|nr:hypothetical protein LOK49_LG01G01619 [Camellia lanceoleosa]
MFVIFVSAKGQPDDGQGQQYCPICQGKHARGAHNKLITSPHVAVFPHPLASDLSFSRYWNYLRKHTFVLESYTTKVNWIMNRALLLVSSYTEFAEFITKTFMSS